MVPHLSEGDRVQFPAPHTAGPEGIVAVGGNLSPGFLLSAYEQGIFPWYDRGPILWHSPDPRFVLFLEELHISRRLRRAIRNDPRQVSMDRDFHAVISNCRTVEREDQPGTWITSEMRDAYVELHRLGHAHSVEVWNGSSLVGGLYGVAVGTLFAGESMFSLEPGASKYALVALSIYLRQQGSVLIDCQVFTEHLASFGAREIPRVEYLTLLESAKRDEPLPSTWSHVDGSQLVAASV